MYTKIEQPRKTFWEEWIAKEVMIRIKIFFKNVRIIKKKKESGHRALFLFLITKWNTPSCKMKLIISYCSCNFEATSNKITQLPESYVTSDKHNVRLI